MIGRGLVVHAAVLVCSAGAAFWVSTRGDEPVRRAEYKVDVWPGRPETFQQLVWEGQKKVSLERRSDNQGAFYVGTVEKKVQVLTPAPEDAGVSKNEPPKQETIRFVSVQEGKELVEALAPLRAYRALGVIGADRAAEFGLDKPEGTLRVTLGGTVHSLLVGASTPGGGDRYAKHEASGAVFAVPGEIVSKLMFAESRLFERDLHAFELEDITEVRIEAQGKTRSLQRIPDRVLQTQQVERKGVEHFWADANTPVTPDETASNWMSKLGRLRPGEFVEKPVGALGPESVLMRLAYFEGRREKGFLELVRTPGEKPDEPDYLVRTEHLRWYAKVLRSTAEQVDQDLPSVVK